MITFAMRLLDLLISLTLATSVLSGDAWSDRLGHHAYLPGDECSRVSPGEILKRVAEADVVFKGYVQSSGPYAQASDRDGDPVERLDRTEFLVLKNYKNAANDSSLTVWQRIPYPKYQTGFRQGGSVIVFARRQANGSLIIAPEQIRSHPLCPIRQIDIENALYGFQLDQAWTPSQKLSRPSGM